MKHEPVFSIVVPVYKVEAYLDKCVQSLIDQTFSDIEIILVDDGSPDKCGKMCDDYAAQDERIKVIHKENGGQADARNQGIKISAGKYIMFVDSDDYLSTDALEKLSQSTQENCDIIVMDAICEGGYKRVVHHVGRYKSVFSGSEYLKAAYKTGSMPMANFLYIYKRDFLTKSHLQYMCGIVHEDDHFISRAFLLANRVIDSGVKEYHYVIRENSTTTFPDKRRNGRDIYTVCQDLLKYFDKIEDIELRAWMIDSLVVKYLSVFQDGRLYRYGDDFIHKDFVRKNAMCKKTKLKALLFCLSPQLYWHINHLTKVGINKNA